MYREVIIFSRWQNFPLPSRSVPPRFAVRIRAVALSQFVQLGDHLFAERGRLQHFQVLAESQYLCDQPPSRGQARFCYEEAAKNAAKAEQARAGNAVFRCGRKKGGR